MQIQQVKFLIFFLLLNVFAFGISFTCLGQSQSFKVVITDSSQKIDSVFFVESTWRNGYSALRISNNKAVKENNRFVFNGTIEYPTAVRIYSLSRNVKFNQLFFIDTGYQELTISETGNKASITSYPNTIINEEYHDFLLFLNQKSLDEKISSGKLLSYVEENSSSYVALYTLIDQTFNYKFFTDYDKVAQTFSQKITKTKGFNFYKNTFLAKKTLPKLVLKNQFGKKININPISQNGDYTLLEFGFEGCYGCAVALGKLEKLYKKGKLKNLKTINIDVINKPIPSLKKNPFWKNYFLNKKNQFENYIVLYSKDEIVTYPTRLLLDDKGTIVFTDIDIDEMISFLIRQQLSK